MWVQSDSQGSPTRFRWRGRGYTVVAVLFSWLESAAWWRLASHDTHVWRVEASIDRIASRGSAAGGSGSVDAANGNGLADGALPSATGVYDLARTNEQWFVRRVMD